MFKSVPKYLFEFILLFAAITSSFWVENYRENQNEREILRKQLQTFVTEYENIDQIMANQFDYKGQYMEPFFELCSLIRNDPSFVLSESDVSLLLGSQRYLVKSSFLDDIYKFSALTQRAEYVHVQSDTLTSFFFQLNDKEMESSLLTKSAYELDAELSDLMVEYDLQYSFYLKSPDSTFYSLRDKLEGNRGEEEKNKAWEALSKDPRLSKIAGGLQITHSDAYHVYDETMHITSLVIDIIKKEIERLE